MYYKSEFININGIEKNKKSVNGITLISLVITIVIMLILAGVSISFLLGENGLINKSKTSKEKYNVASIKERVETIITEYQFDKTQDEEKKFIDFLNENKDNENLKSVKEVDESNIDIDVDKYTVKINSDTLEIVSIKDAEKGVTNMMGTYSIKSYNSSNGTLMLNVTLKCDNNIDKVTCPDESIKENVNNKVANFDYEVQDGDLVNFVANAQGDIYNYSIQTKGFTKMDTVELTSLEDFNEMKTLVNLGYGFECKTINLTKDINLASECYKVDGTYENDVSWTPIGNLTNQFKGIFNGNNKVIKNLYINKNENMLGLFGYAGTGAKISNLKLDNVYCKGATNIAGLVGQTEADLIEHVIVSGNVIGTVSYVGGITGFSTTAISKCGNNAKIEGANFVGGLAGANIKDTYQSYNKGNVTGNSYVAGVVANLVGNMNNCYNRGNVTGIESIGGITGSTYASVYYCYNTGNISASGTYNNKYACAGIAGYQGKADASYIYGCYNLGTIYGNGNVGGLAGESRGTIVYGYNNASVTSSKAANSYVGPIAGYQGGTMKNVQSGGTFPSVYSIVNLNNVNNGVWGEDTENVNGGYPLLSHEV